MNRPLWLLFFCCSCSSLFADTIYMIGFDNDNKPSYWTLLPPAAPSSFQELDVGSNPEGFSNGVAFAPNQTVYIVGQVENGDDTSAVYWTVPPSGSASSSNAITGTSSFYTASANAVAFAPSGIGYIVGEDGSQNPSYWTISPSGVVSSPTELLIGGGYISAVNFTSSGIGYIAGVDTGDNVCYWSISAGGVISGPFGLVGGESGGSASPYAISTSPLSGITYITGANTGGHPCYWTISPLGIASSAVVLDGGINSQARGIAFLPDGSGIMVGQAEGNVSCYWLISSLGDVGTDNALPNGSGGGSNASGVVFSSDGTAYIVGMDNANHAVYWTLLDNIAEYNTLDSGSFANGIAISLSPNPPENLFGKYVKNNFGWIYEYCAVLTWTPSSSAGVAAYNIYKNGAKIGTVSGSTTQYESHDQKKSKTAVYAVTAVNSSGDESTPTTVTIN